MSLPISLVTCFYDRLELFGGVLFSVSSSHELPTGEPRFWFQDAADNELNNWVSQACTTQTMAWTHFCPFRCHITIC